MQIRNNYIAHLTANDEISTSVFVRAYIEEGVFLTDDEMKAQALIAYANLRKCPLVLINSMEEITPTEYLAKLKSRELDINSVDAQVTMEISVSVDYLDEIDMSTWRTLRRHMISEGTVEVRV